MFGSVSNRAAKGFTVIQAVVLAELGGTDVPNANGDLPLIFYRSINNLRAGMKWSAHVAHCVHEACYFLSASIVLPTRNYHAKDIQLVFHCYVFC